LWWTGVVWCGEEEGETNALARIVAARRTKVVPRTTFVTRVRSTGLTGKRTRPNKHAEPNATRPRSARKRSPGPRDGRIATI
jgi:hypothetical protein